MSRTLRKMGVLRLSVVCMVIMFIFIVLIGPLITPYDPLSTNMRNALQPPNSRHWFGTDTFGRDVFSRMLYGGIMTLGISGVAVVGAMCVGIPLGLLPVLSPLWMGQVVRRATEIMLSWPGIFLAMALMGILGPGAKSLVIALGAVRAPRIAVIVHSRARQLMEEGFVEAARAAGASATHIAIRHLLPNIFPILFVQIIFQLASAIMAESALSFLGVGVIPPTPSWGNIIAEAKTVLQVAPWFVMLPGSVIVIFVLLLNITGDILTDVMTPKRQ